ncbi:MAG: hypothetical protein ACREBD_15230 [Blastocatellia bacterium]
MLVIYKSSSWKQMAGNKWLETNGWKQMAGNKWLETNGWKQNSASSSDSSARVRRRVFVTAADENASPRDGGHD